MIKSNLIAVAPLANGFAVTFPFELKESFKAAFKTSKWNADDKYWPVGVRSKKRLDQWIELVAPVLEEMEEDSADLLAGDDLRLVQIEIENTRSTLFKARTARLDTAASAEELSGAQDVLEKLKAEFDEEKDRIRTAQSETSRLLGEVCDLNKISFAHSAMKSAHGQRGTKSREAFNDAKGVMIEQVGQLQKAGFYSAGLSALADMKFNRPDRDIPNDVTYNDLFMINPVNND